tara:strand:+ start:179937 stop:182174 length:2238 start_codon:yes stop_codon:yes gene_type:complete
MFNKSIFASFLAVIFSIILFTPTSGAEEPHVSARIITDHENISTTKPFNIGVELNIQPGWHIYWENPGDTGFKTEIDLTFDKNVNVLEPFKTKTPQTFNTAGLINYGFDKNVLYFTAAEYTDAKNDFSLFVTANIKYLVCNEICIPEEISVQRAFTLGSDTTPSVDASVFATAQSLTAISNPNVSASAKNVNHFYVIEIKGLDSGVASASFIPNEEGIIEDNYKQTWIKTNSGYTLTLKKDIQSKKDVKDINGILNLDGKNSIFLNSALQVKATPAIVKSEQPKNANIKETKTVPTITPAEEPTKNAEAAKTSVQTKTEPTQSTPLEVTEKSDELFTIQDIQTSRTLQVTLLLAFLGGLILNLMPCVLPVLALKALSLLHHAKSYFSWWYGLVYTAGILATFSLLALAMITLKANGETLGWGFQLQSPIVVASIALIMLLVGLQLASVFNFGASFGRLQNLVSGHGTIATFFSGMLITIVATPCTAPFMATAIAFSFVQPDEIIYATFAALGLGLAFPYLLITFFTPLLKLLPKPGAWEVTFQHFLAFPMFATVLWLTWVYAKQTSLEELFLLLIAIFVVSFTTWIFGRFNVLSASRIKRWFGLLIFLSGIAYYFFTVHAFDQWYISKNTHVEWEKWSTESVQEGLAQDRHVFVNFTADWCITCKVNEKIVLELNSTKDLIEKHGVKMLKADWTSKDDTISAELKRFNRYGVPLYLMYSPKSPESPLILNQILTSQEFEEALTQK